MTDVLLKRNGAAVLAWDRVCLETAGGARDRHLAALRAADMGDYALLMVFVRT